MELDLNALEMLDATEESELWPCNPTCSISCGGSCGYSCSITG